MCVASVEVSKVLLSGLVYVAESVRVTLLALRRAIEMPWAQSMVQSMSERARARSQKCSKFQLMSRETFSSSLPFWVNFFFCLLVTSTIRSTISVLMWWAWWFPVFFLSLWNSDRNKEKKIPQIRLVQQSRTNTRHRKTRKMLRKRVHKETSLSRWAPFFESLPGSIHDSRFRDKSHDITLWQWSCRKVSDASECVCCVCCPFRGWSLIDSKKVFFWKSSRRGFRYL